MRAAYYEQTALRRMCCAREIRIRTPGRTSQVVFAGPASTLSDVKMRAGGVGARRRWPASFLTARMAPSNAVGSVSMRRGWAGACGSGTPPTDGRTYGAQYVVLPQRRPSTCRTTCWTKPAPGLGTRRSPHSMRCSRTAGSRASGSSSQRCGRGRFYAIQVSHGCSVRSRSSRP